MSAPERNFLYAMLNAVNRDQQSMQWQEITDSNTTIKDAAMEENYYSAWDLVLKNDAQTVAHWANSTDPNAQQQLQAAQAQYQEDSTTAQSQQNMCDGATQASQSTTGQDGQRLSDQAGLAATLSSVGQAMAGMLSQSYNH